MAALDLHEFTCSDEAVQTFNTIILDTAKESVTFKYRKKSNHKRKNKKKSWMDQDCFSLRCSLKSLGRKVMKNPNNIDLGKTFIKVRNDYKKLRKKATCRIHKKKKNMSTQLEDTCNTNPKLF